ncbi:MAG: DinB family protein [Saprospiraceae bacterium]
MEEINQLLIQEVRRRLMAEGVVRIKQCLSELTPKEVWLRPNANSNSVGNLVLHLCGNVRQWIVSGLGGLPDTRQRATEFNETGPLPSAELLSRLDAVMREVDDVLNRLKPEDLTKPIVVQGFEETGLSILVHVVEHFSYHVGQITYFVKWRKNIDTAYYGGIELG